jgi:pyridoxine kinase
MPGGDTGILAVGRDGEARYRTTHVASAPKGSGDVFSARIAAGLTVHAALGHLQALVEASSGATHLQIVGAADRWTQASAISCDGLPAAEG